MFLLLLSCLTIGVLSSLSFSFLLKIKNSPHSKLRAWLFVSSRKSSSDAILLGGMVINLASIFAAVIYYTLFSSQTASVLHVIPSLMIIFIHGYLDDKLEISPRFKLLCQLTSVGIFTALTAPLLPFSWWQVTPVMMVLGFAVLNGTNLLDGLDTMQMKLSSFSLIFYAAVAVLYHSTSVVVISLIALCSLLSFYPFNREPAKIHMGEIGANSLGMLFVFLSTMLFEELTGTIGHWDAMVISAIPLALPVVELSTSFARRLIAGKSPFRSDRLHIHHILLDHYQFSAGGSSTLIMLFFATIGTASLIFCRFNPWYALFFEYTALYYCYIRFGYAIWSKKSTQNKVIYSAKMTRLKKRKLTVIDCSTIDNFQMTFHQQVRRDHSEDYRKAS